VKSSSFNLKAAAQALEDYWSPQVVGKVNDQYVKVAKLKGSLAWHKHDMEDELFLILSGRLRMEYESHSIDLVEGEFHVVPRGTMHNPVCEEECLVALIETVTTKHTGDLEMDKTKSIEEQLTSDENSVSA